ncbi:MAG: heterocyst formation ABC transporter subunit HepA [Bacteroidota bacterium]
MNFRSLITRTISRPSRILLGVFRKFWYYLIFTLCFAILAAICEGFSIGLLIPFLRNIGDSGEAFSTGWTFVDQHILGVDKPQLERLYRICGIILVASWGRSGFSYLSEAFATVARVKYVMELRSRVVDQLLSVSLSYYSRTKTGELINSLTTEISRVIQSFQIINVFLIRGTLMIVYIGFMFFVSWELSVIILTFFVLLSLTLTRLLKTIQHGGKKVTKAAGYFTTSLTELINGIRTIAAFNTQTYERGRMDNAINGLADSMIKNGWQRLKVGPLSQGFVSTILIGIILVATQYYVLPGELDIALLLAFLFALLRMMPLVNELNKQRGMWASLRGSLLNVADLLRTDNKPYLADGERVVEPLKEAIEFENVTFGYGEEIIVLKDVNITIERGKTTAIIGASGAGKSTLVDLIPRFHDPIAGRVLWDGVDLRESQIDSLRPKIAVVSQSTFIFNETVWANIAYGLKDIPKEKIYEAARRSNALDFIEQMEEGFDTVLGDRGVRLSGGQRQRVAIARALLRDPDILILDEATSALDSLSERLVQQSLEELMQGRTVIAIAHRLSTIENADKVVVLEEGEVVEQGPYQELLEKKGKLWEYHALQYQLEVDKDLLPAEVTLPESAASGHEE